MVAGFHRAQFLDVLLSLIDKDRITSHNSKRLTSFVQTDDINTPIQLNFADGTTAHADVLVGSDGIHSAVRHTLLKSIADKLEATGGSDNLKQAADFRDSIEAVWSGTTCYRAVIPCTRLKVLNPEHRSLTRPLLVSVPFSNSYRVRLIVMCVHDSTQERIR